MKKFFVFSVMMLAVASVGSAQVSFTVDVDVTGTINGSAYANTYVPTADKFISYNSGALNISVHNAATGAVEGTLNNGAATPSGLGFFGIAAGSDGVIYAVNAGDAGMFRWASTAAAATLAATPAAFARCGQVTGTGVNTAVYFAGSADDGPIEKFTTTDGVNFTLAEVIDATAARAKSGFAVNAAGTAVWAVGDVNTNVQKGVFDGSEWVVEDTTFTANSDAAGSGPMTYDNTNDVVFAQKMSGDIVYAIDGTDGSTLGSQALTDDTYNTAGYSGAWCDPASTTLWTAARGATGAAHYAKLTYSVTSVDDWTLY